MAEPLKVLVPIADGSEEIETSCITDTLVRAGAAVTVATASGEVVKMSRGLKIVADCKVDDCVDKDWDAIVIPGGMPGATNLRDSAAVTALLKKQSGASKVTAAMCASPAVVFKTHDLLPGKAVCYPKFKEELGEKFAGDGIPVMQDGHIITGTGPGTSLQFALKIVEALYSKEKAEELAAGMLTTTA